MTWPDLNKLLRTSGDSITAPHACPPAFEEQPIRMSPAAALASQRNIMSSRVYGLQIGNVGATTVTRDLGALRELQGYSSPSDSETVIGVNITAANERSPCSSRNSPRAHPEPRSVKEHASSESDSNDNAGDEEDYSPDQQLQPSPSPAKRRSLRRSPTPAKQRSLRRSPSPAKRPKMKLVKSTSLQSYFLPNRGAGATRAATTVATRDPSRPICDGQLDPCDRETAEDISWSTPVSPLYGGVKKRKSPSGRGIIDV